MRNLITYLVSPDIWIDLETIIKPSACYDYDTCSLFYDIKLKTRRKLISPFC
jgi:hypothetical protein